MTLYCLHFLYRRIWLQLSTSFKADCTSRLVILKKAFVDSKEPTTEHALVLLVRLEQQHHFVDLLHHLQSGSSSHPLIRQLGIRMGNDGLLRCHGRLENANLGSISANPLLLPRKTTLTHLIIKNVHEQLLHSGVSHTLSQLRMLYWVPQGRAEVKHVIKQCTTCRRHEGPPYALPAMPPLPKERVNRAFPFQYTGLDVMGPLYFKESKTTNKLWVCLFTCLATRAIHLEYLLGMSTEWFMSCFHRFVSRRGYPQIMQSDNAPQFKAADATLNVKWKEVLRSREVQDPVTMRGVKWKFTVEYAPWSGGVYERLIGLVKRNLRKCIGRRLLTLEQLVTLLCQVEATVNSRPLTYVAGDGEFAEVITPSHFLFTNRTVGTAIPISCPPEDVEDPDFVVRNDSAQQLEQQLKSQVVCADKFWLTWQREYLASLRQGSSHHRQHNRVSGSPVVGEVVVVHDENSVRSQWKLGRVTDIIKSADGEVRSVQVLMPNKRMLTRSVCHIYPMEVPGDVTISEVPVSSFSESSRNSPTVTRNVPRRQAAAKALQRLANCLN